METRISMVSVRRLAMQVLCGAWLLAAPGLLVAQESARAQSQDRGMSADLLAAQAFMLAAYPDLLGRPLELQLRREGNVVLVSVADASEARTPGASREPLVTARFDYDRDTRLQRFDAHGPWVEDERHAALRDAVLSNPKWAESDADVVLTRAGAVSMFDTTLRPVQPAAIAAVERQVGAREVGTPARFLWYQDASPGGPPLAVFRTRPVWATEAVAEGPNGEAWTYRFEYEPFGGRLVTVVRR